MHSIVIVTHNSSEDIGACLNSVRDHSPDARIIILDNGSTDGAGPQVGAGTVALLRSRGIEETHLDTENRGYAAAANRGAYIAVRYDPETITFLNPDTIVTPGWLDRMAGYLARDGGLAAVGPVTNYVAGAQKYQAWMPPNDRRALGPFGDISGLLSEANAGRSADTKVLIGFCMMIRREAWEALGPFDERCGLGLEDLEWSLRARRAGHRLAIATDVMIYHRGQRSFRSLDPVELKRREDASRAGLLSVLDEWYPDGIPSAKELWGIEWFDTRARVTA